MRTYKRRKVDTKDPYQAQALPITKPVAVYYRQSTEAQIGNVSTTLQTVDMVEHLVRLGWAPESIIMIDMDAGISGRKTIEERPGMSQLMRLIEGQEIGAVAAQDVDRFFRDVTQIQTNIFIDACHRNDVLVVTPSMVYDFDHPIHGRLHTKMFREQAQQAADYLEYHVRGRLVKSRQWRQERGLWTGNGIAAGYVVDMRPQLGTGERNPDYRKYVPFELYAEVVRAYFELFRQYKGCINQTWRHIQQHGPFFPEYDPVMIPDGFRYRPYFRSRSKITGKLCPSKSGMTSYLTNVVYIGHWSHQQTIVVWGHHQPLIEHDLFMFAFNGLSKTDFHGKPNPDYAPYWKAKRHPKSERDKPYPIYADLLFSDDLADRPHQRLAAVWNAGTRQYQYNLYISNETSCVWNIQARYVDLAIDEVLLARLQTLTLDETEWQSALTSTQAGSLEDIRQIERQIQHEQQTQDNIIASLRTLTNEEMIHRAQANYEAATRRIETLQTELDSLRMTQQYNKQNILARDALQQIIGQWEQVPREERRRIFEDLARFAKLTRISRYEKELVVHWKDGTTSPLQSVTRHTTRTTTPNYRHNRYWSQDEIDRICQMMDAHMHQVEILRAFPGHRFFNLLKCYARHGTPDRKYTHYQGERPYGVKTRWEDTEEYRREQRP